MSKLDLNESLNLTKFDSVKLFLELCLEISKEYKDRGIFRRVEIFNEPVEAMSRLANSPDENDNKNSSKDVRFRVFDILAPQITGAIKAKRGGDSYKKLIELNAARTILVHLHPFIRTTIFRFFHFLLSKSIRTTVFSFF